jgi:hypothetical protein
VATILDSNGDFPWFCDPNDVPNITSTLGLNNAGGAREAINEIGRRNITLVVIFSRFVYFLALKILMAVSISLSEYGIISGAMGVELDIVDASGRTWASAV